MKANEMTDFDLDAVLAAARDADPVPSDALMSRVMADALALQPRAVAQNRAQSGLAFTPLRWLDWLAAVFGGGGAVAGIGMALVAGVFFGIAQPAPVAMLTGVWLDETLSDGLDLFPAETAFWVEPQND